MQPDFGLVKVMAIAAIVLGIFLLGLGAIWCWDELKWRLNLYRFRRRWFVPLVLLMLCVPRVHAQQTFDFTLTNDAAFCGAACSTVVGSGQFSIGTAVTQVNMTLFPITSLSGTLNGQAVTLFAPPINSIAYNSSANYFHTLAQPIAPFFPLLITNGTQLWNIQATDFNHTGSGQTMYDYAANQFTPVSFTASDRFTSILQPTPGPPVTFSTPTPAQINTALQKRAEINVGLAVGVPVAFAATMWVIHHEIHRQHRQALPAGRF